MLKRCSEMEEQEDGWLTVLEKNGLGPAATILDDYGIASETDLLVLDLVVAPDVRPSGGVGLTSDA